MGFLKSFGPTIFVCIPIIITILFYQVHVRIKHHKWRAIHFSVQYSAVFYVMAVAILLDWIFGKNYTGFILIFLIVLLAVIMTIQWRTKTEVLLLEGLTVLWRLCFLLFSLTYAGLLLYVVISGYVA